MLIQFTKETSGPATGHNRPGRSLLRDGASRNSATQLRADPPRLLVPVAPSRVEENDGASFLSACCSALIDIAAVLSAFTLASATGFAIAFSFFVLLFVSL